MKTICLSLSFKTCGSTAQTTAYSHLGKKEMFMHIMSILHTHNFFSPCASVEKRMVLTLKENVCRCLTLTQHLTRVLRDSADPQSTTKEQFREFDFDTALYILAPQHPYVYGHRYTHTHTHTLSWNPWHNTYLYKAQVCSKVVLSRL